MKYFFSGCIIIQLFFSCSSTPTNHLSSSKGNVIEKKAMAKTDDLSLKEAKLLDTLQKFQTLTIAGHSLDIALPEGTLKGHLLILQGFAFPKDDWCKKSSLCKKALAEGYLLIMPEMGKSTYSQKFYPQTRPDWQVYPKRGWLVDTVFTYLQEKYGILKPGQNNYIVGLSTGARGVALIALDKPGLFTAVAALSGDYDQTKIPQDKVLIGYYGPYQQFKERWQKDDNILHQIKYWKTPIYLGHGQMDKVTPASQTQLFYEALKKAHPDLNVVFSYPRPYGHDYTYWDYEVDNILTFFRKFH